MVAWARAWRSYTSETPPVTPSCGAEPHIRVPLELVSQVALVLTEMIFNLRKQEVCSC